MSYDEFTLATSFPKSFDLENVKDYEAFECQIR